MAQQAEGSECSTDGVAAMLAQATRTRKPEILYLSENVRTARAEVLPVLQRAGYRVRVGRIHLLRSLLMLRPSCDLVLLEVGGRDAIGYHVCSQIRQLSRLPILVILCDAARWDVVRAFEMGADMYVLAPIRTGELLARVAALLRRSCT